MGLFMAAAPLLVLLIVAISFLIGFVKALIIVSSALAVSAVIIFWFGFCSSKWG